MFQWRLIEISHVKGWLHGREKTEEMAYRLSVVALKLNAEILPLRAHSLVLWATRFTLRLVSSRREINYALKNKIVPTTQEHVPSRAKFTFLT
jgi:hypothetical protein